MRTSDEKKADRNAAYSAFGWDFQVHTAIMLAIRNIRDMTSITVEGSTEDVEIWFGEERRLYCQAKAHAKANCPGEGSTGRINDAMNSLAEAFAKDDCIGLVFATNDPMPFGKKIAAGNFGRESFFHFHELEEKQRGYLERTMAKAGIAASATELLYIYVFRFQGSDQDTRYEKANDAIRAFLGSLRVSDALLIPPEKLRRIWYGMLDFDSTIKPDEGSKTISKKSFVWPIVFELVELHATSSSIAGIDEDSWEDAQVRYRQSISAQSERFDVFTRIAADYDEFRKMTRGSSKTTKELFLEEHWQDYVSLLGAEGIPEEENRTAFVCLVMTKIIKKRMTIAEVKDAVNLRD